MEAAKQHPLFKQLDAVKNNHSVAMDGSLWASIGGPLAIVDDLERTPHHQDTTVGCLGGSRSDPAMPRRRPD
ncbi:MAG: hypothetical protein AB7N70_02975 [Dehalococcoidia bacterium]